MNDYDETALVRRARKRDERALEILLMKYQSYLYRIAYAFYKNEQSALDAVSECVAKVYVNLPKLRQPEYFKTWMTRILINEVLKGRRERDISLDELREQGFSPEYHEEGLSPEERMDLYQALEQLPATYRKVLILKYFNDLKIAEIAQIMETPEGTIKSLLCRGREKLRLIYMEEMDDARYEL